MTGWLYHGVAAGQRSGHHTWQPGWVMAWVPDLDDTIEGEAYATLNYGRTDAGRQPECEWVAYVVGDRRFIAWWDRSGDPRFGSVSIIAAPIGTRLMDMFDRAPSLWPGLMERQRQPMTPAGAHERILLAREETP